MPEHIMPIGDAIKARSFNSLDDFTQGYVQAMFFTECHSDAPELEEMTFGDLAPATLAAMVEDCKAFQESCAADLEIAYATGYEPNQAGIDFWLTRNGHGAGFWDRGLGAVGDRLSDACEPWGSRYAYAGDDGRLYVE